MRRLIVVIGAASVLFTAAPAYAGLSDPYGFAQNYPEDVQSWADAIGITFDQALARMDARQDVDAAVVAINDQPDIYTGVYFTQDAQTYVLHVVSKQGATPTDALKSVGPLTVVHETAPRSSTDLSKLRTSVEDSGIPFSTIEFNIPDGSLIVTVPTASNASDVTASFGDSVVVDVGPRLKTISCTSRSNCSPYRGGIVVKSGPDSTHYEYCTWGYTARGKTDGVLKMLTAQHCEEGYATGTWYHNGLYGNVGTRQDGDIGGLYDAMIISGSVGSQGGPYNDLYYDDANTTYFINGIRPYTDQQVGDLVNMTGFTSGTHAGKQILAYNFNWQISYGGNVYTLTGDKVASAMAGGDSGGPVYYTGNAYGMTDAIGSNFTVYVWAGFQASDLGVNICVTSSC